MGSKLRPQGGHILGWERQGKWLPDQGIERVNLILDEPYTHDFMAVQRGMLSLDAQARSWAGQYLRHALAVVIRELKPSTGCGFAEHIPQTASALRRETHRWLSLWLPTPPKNFKRPTVLRAKDRASPAHRQANQVARPSGGSSQASMAAFYSRYRPHVHEGQSWAQGLFGSGHDSP